MEPTPTPEPTAEPTAEPTEEPTAEPTEEPTAEPTDEPTEEPTATAEPTPTATTDDAPAEGQVLLEERCTVCHSLARVESAQKTREEWASTVDRMIDRGAQLSDGERTVVIDYLAETYGP
jgi:cytochrome c5